jgi:predicted porin
MATTYSFYNPETESIEKVSTTIKSARKNRYALSAEYDKNEYTFRAEYLHNQGYGSNLDLGDKADGWYAFGIVPVIKSKLHAKARYQCYRSNKEWNKAKTMYEIGANYYFSKKLQLNFEYARVNDRSLAKHNYNFADLELDFRF